MARVLRVSNTQRFGVQWMVDRFLAPSIPNWVARSVTEITIGATGYETWGRTLQYEHQTDIDAGDPHPRPGTTPPPPPASF